MLYWIAHVLVSMLARLFLRMKVVGIENVPRDGGAIIAANHMSYLDIPLLGCALRRRADFIGKSELFRNPIVGLIFRQLGGFPIKRGRIDRSALAETVRRLKAGRLVVFYPEGRRSEDGRLQRPKPGIGMVAVKAQVPIIPALIEGTGQILPKRSRRLRFHPVVIRFGPPLDSSKFQSEQDKLTYTKISQAVMEGIQKLRN
ncbi:MAG: 1-acyl-sn-glycerol-3-phosphate acyltransferase [Nitrospira sp.]|nr:1-acyl-sn-glycerol-3-phosphate acyltransferase [Nitrospira sp.]